MGLEICFLCDQCLLLLDMIERHRPIQIADKPYIDTTSMGSKGEGGAVGLSPLDCLRVQLLTMFEDP